MSKDAIKNRLKKSKAEIHERFHVKELGLFGSFVRNEQTKSSDLDVLVDFEKPIGWDVVDLQEHLEKLLGVKVDLVLKKGIMRNKKLWNVIKDEILYV